MTESKKMEKKVNKRILLLRMLTWFNDGMMSGEVIPRWYSEGEHDKIIEYIKIEAKEFARFCMWLYKELPDCLKKFKEANNIK